MYNEMINTCRHKDPRIKVMPSPLNNSSMEQATSWDPCCHHLPFPSSRRVHTHALFFACSWELYSSLPSHSIFFKKVWKAIPHKVSAGCCRVALPVTPWHSPSQFLQMMSYHQHLRPSTEDFLLPPCKEGWRYSGINTFCLPRPKTDGREWGKFACVFCFWFCWFFFF